MSRISHIVWDWNGTLFADNRALIEATVEAFVAAGFTSVSRELYQRYHDKAVDVFFERLAGRKLRPEEHRQLLEDFRSRYAGYVNRTELAADARTALIRWKETGRRQSLLSLYDHQKLLRLTAEKGIDLFFDRIDGARESTPDRKSPHLARHLRILGVDPAESLVIGDSVDDALAAEECGARCVLYHAGEFALHARDSVDKQTAVVVTSLTQAVDYAVSS